MAYTPASASPKNRLLRCLPEDELRRAKDHAIGESLPDRAPVSPVHIEPVAFARERATCFVAKRRRAVRVASLQQDAVPMPNVDGSVEHESKSAPLRGARAARTVERFVDDRALRTHTKQHQVARPELVLPVASVGRRKMKVEAVREHARTIHSARPAVGKGDFASACPIGAMATLRRQD